MFYKLNGHTPVACRDVLEWAQWFEKADEARVVAQDHIGGVFVSTVFMGVDTRPSLQRTPPPLFETKVFENGDTAGVTHGTYPTWEEAKARHRDAVVLASGRAQTGG